MSKPWFAAKRIGYGASFPISWEGWLVTLALVAGIIGASRIDLPFLSDDWRMLGRIGLVLVPIAVFLPIVRAKTEGGWRWRNGE